MHRPGGECVKRQISVSQYRTIDLTLFAFMTVVFESVTALAGARWFPKEAWEVSVTGALSAVVLVRWGWPGGLIGALGGAVRCLALGGSPRQLLVYAAGNLACLALLPLVKPERSERWRRDTLRCMGFGGLTLLLQQTGRALISLCLGAGLPEALRFYTTDVLSMLFTLVILWIVKRLDGVLENQTCYLARIGRESRETDEGGFR